MAEESRAVSAAAHQRKNCFKKKDACVGVFFRLLCNELFYTDDDKVREFTTDFIRNLRDTNRIPINRTHSRGYVEASRV